MPSIPIDIELGEHGLYYGTSAEMKGLLIAGDSPEQVMARADKAIEELRSAGSPNEPLEPDSPEEWDLEQRAFYAFNNQKLPQEVRDLIGQLWAEVCAREKWKS